LSKAISWLQEHGVEGLDLNHWDAREEGASKLLQAKLVREAVALLLL
jgi:hypothetical protein